MSNHHLHTALAGEVADQVINRQPRCIEDAITSTALQLVTTRDDMAVLLPVAINLWNRTADQIEADFGKGWFPVWLAHANAFSFRFVGADGKPMNPTSIYGHLTNRLTYLAATKADKHPFRWMADVLFMACFTSEEKIAREAGPRNSWWHRKGRKRKANILLAQHKAYLNSLDEQKQDREESQTRKFWRDHDRAEAKLDDAVRSDRSYSRTLPVQLTKDED